MWKLNKCFHKFSAETNDKLPAALNSSEQDVTSQQLGSENENVSQTNSQLDNTIYIATREDMDGTYLNCAPYPKWAKILVHQIWIMVNRLC